MPVTPPKRKAAPGTWPSPLSTARLFAPGTELRRGLGQMALDGADLYWLEGRPQDGGRNVVCRRNLGGQVTDASPPGVSVRTRVHEYGGGDFTVAAGTLFYVAEHDQGIHAWQPGADSPPTALTPPPASGRDRFADLVVDASRRRLVCVREHHADGAEPANSLVAVAMDGSGVTTLATGADFHASPAISPSGDALAWLQWNHPNMPWDGCELWLAQFDADGLPVRPGRVAGGADESIFQPAWSPDGVLHFVSDRSGWWNLWRQEGERARSVCPMEAEMGLPQWVFGATTYGFASADTAVCTFTRNGSWTLASVALRSGIVTPIDVPHDDIANLRVGDGVAWYRGAAPTRPAALVAVDLATGAASEVYSPETLALDAADISIPQAIEFPTTDGATARGFFYAPQNAGFEAAAGTLPPLLVIGHGGPTAAASTALDLKIQFWTTRGFAVLDVNYRGSTGFGRAYRDALKGRWGLADVDDCVAGARHLVDRGLVDSARLAIRGSSAGGFTVLCALTFHDTFRAGASYYGISDLEALARDTHKFESHYTDTLVGPWPEGPWPGRSDLYRERSPIHFVDRLACPLIVFQGLKDEVVPPGQAEAIVAALRAKRLPVAFLTFANEGHGFRDASNGRRALEAELSFYAQVFGFTPADDLPALTVENL